MIPEEERIALASALASSFHTSRIVIRFLEYFTAHMQNRNTSRAHALAVS